MSAVQIAQDIYWVGAIDWNLRFCGSYNTPRGTTYNAYLIIDEKITLIDSTKDYCSDEMFARIAAIIDPANIDYVIVQHAEMDHAGAMDKVRQKCPKAEFITTKAGKDTLEEHFLTPWDVKIVKTGDELKLGKRTLRFIQAAMLHWPDNMFSYAVEDGILFSNDAFGCHVATSERFSDEIGHVAIEEAAKYFAVIVSPYVSFVQKKLTEIAGLDLDIKMIAPSHGTIWRDPAEIFDLYKKWSAGEAEERITIAFDTMWHSTEKMAAEIARGIMHEDVAVSIYNLRTSDWGSVVCDILMSKIYCIGSPTLNRGIYPSVAGFLHFLKGLKLQHKEAVLFGSYGWGTGAIEAMTEELQRMKTPVIDSIKVKYVPCEEELKKCFELGVRLAQAVKK